MGAVALSGKGSHFKEYIFFLSTPVKCLITNRKKIPPKQIAQYDGKMPFGPVV